jgi:hypothetical protein
LAQPAVQSVEPKAPLYDTGVKKEFDVNLDELVKFAPDN